MSKRVTLVLAVGFVALVAACTKPEPAPVYVEPVTVEPAYTGKYK